MLKWLKRLFCSHGDYEGHRLKLSDDLDIIYVECKHCGKVWGSQWISR